MSSKYLLIIPGASLHCRPTPIKRQPCSHNLEWEETRRDALYSWMKLKTQGCGGIIAFWFCQCLMVHGVLTTSQSCQLPDKRIRLVVTHHWAKRVYEPEHPYGKPVCLCHVFCLCHHVHQWERLWIEHCWDYIAFRVGRLAIWQQAVTRRPRHIWASLTLFPDLPNC
jgi:hypothetical protein